MKNTGIGVALLVLCLGILERTDAAQPNIIYILADDLGYGDLSCYGQQTLNTPHLDAMAKQGMRFTRHYAGSTVCAPSRCVLLTGLHTGHCRVRGNGAAQLQPDDVTFATELQKSGYKTGAFGKWGVGNPPPLDDPQQHGFGDFYGYINMFHAHNYYPEFLVKNGKKVPLRNKLYPDWREKRTGPREGAGVAEVAVDYAPELIAKGTLDFIRRHREGPFFLYYALNIPHANNEAGGEKRIGRNGMRVPDLGEFANKNWPIQEKGFARMIQQIDDDVGNILGLLKELKIDKNTLVIFSSDNGPHQEGGHKVDHFDSNGALRGTKRDLYEGGIREPMIAWWPGTVPANRTSNHVSAFQDIFPTVLELSGVKEWPRTDGISMVPTLFGKPADQPQHAHLYWEFQEQGGKRAVVKGNWKAVQRNTSKPQPLPIEIYDLANDLSEEHDVAKNHPKLVAEMATIMQREHVAEE